MSVAVVKEVRVQVRQGLPVDFRRGGRVYAIAFDMDIEQLRTNDGDPSNDASREFRRVRQRHRAVELLAPPLAVAAPPWR